MAKKLVLDSEAEGRASDLVEKGWIKAWMLFEVQATNKKTTEDALREHLKKLAKEKGVKVAKQKFTSVQKIEVTEMAQQRGITELYSQVAEAVILAQAFEVLVNVTINYGPSAIEILAPENLKLSMRDMQNALTSISDVMHKFASAGIGGFILSPT